MSYAERTNRAIATPSGNGYAITRRAPAGPFYGECPWCREELDGKGCLAHLENGFDPETLDPTFAPAQVVCRGCANQAFDLGRLRI